MVSVVSGAASAEPFRARMVAIVGIVTVFAAFYVAASRFTRLDTVVVLLAFGFVYAVVVHFLAVGLEGTLATLVAITLFVAHLEIAAEYSDATERQQQDQEGDSPPLPKSSFQDDSAVKCGSVL